MFVSDFVEGLRFSKWRGKEGDPDKWVIRGPMKAVVKNLGETVGVQQKNGSVRSITLADDYFHDAKYDDSGHVAYVEFTDTEKKGDGGKKPSDYGSKERAVAQAKAVPDGDLPF